MAQPAAADRAPARTSPADYPTPVGLFGEEFAAWDAELAADEAARRAPTEVRMWARTYVWCVLGPLVGFTPYEKPAAHAEAIVASRDRLGLSLQSAMYVATAPLAAHYATSRRP